MSTKKGGRIYEELGVRPVINAGGNMTLLGGSRLSPKVSQAMEDANAVFVDMRALLERSGQIIAELLGAEAALVTPGCCAALALGAAACMTGHDPAKIGQLPDVTGLRHEIIIQKGLRLKYDRCVTVPGAKLVEVGEEAGTTAKHIEAAIGAKTAAIHYAAPSRSDGVVSLEEVIAIGKRHGVPVIVDAAAQVYPVENMRRYATMGADLVCFGAKYFGAPNSSGILCGRKDLVEAAALQSFIGFEANPYRGFGRPLKLDRQEIVAVVVALREWMTMDHQARLASYQRRIANLTQALQGLSGLEITPQGTPPIGVRIALDEASLGKSAAQVSEALLAGEPSIWVRVQPGAITVNVITLEDGEEMLIAEALRRVLGR